MAHLDMTCIEHRAPETARDTQMATIQTLKPMLGSVHHYAVDLVQISISEDNLLLKVLPERRCQALAWCERSLQKYLLIMQSNANTMLCRAGTPLHFHRNA